MKRWNIKKNERQENLAVDALISEILSVCKKHGMSIAHEDAHGAFVIEDYSDGNAEWLMDAHDDTGSPAPAVDQCGERPPNARDEGE